ncbi:MAG: translation initiation factor IF-2, partial [Fervidobacterium pennivorans]
MDTKELLHELEELGIEVKSHMSFIDEETVNILLEIYKETLDEEEDVTLTKTKEPTKEKVEAKKPPVHITEEDLKLDKFAEKIKVPQNRIIQDFFMKGEVLRPGQPISVSLAKKIAKMYDVRLTFEEEQGKEEVKLENPLDELKRQFEILYQDKEQLVPRPPVVTVMGHVDHGKTTLLDYIRKTRIAEKEEGGITQSIGAYQVVVNGKKITFIDTPGHEVFTEMRARGAQATDIVVLVVAADDGVMPQTIEAYNHAKSANVPIIVAINKIDKPNANVELTKQDLVTKLNLIPEEWGGDTIVVPISARNGTNVDTLLEMILLVAEMQDIRCIPDKPVRAVTIETRLDKGYGPVANAIVKDGILKVGDYVVAGKVYGKVKALIDDKGKRINQAEPSTPVMLVGFEELPDPHSIIYVVESKEKAEEIIKGGTVDISKDLINKEFIFDFTFKPRNEREHGYVKESLQFYVKSEVIGENAIILDPELAFSILALDLALIISVFLTMVMPTNIGFMALLFDRQIDNTKTKIRLQTGFPEDVVELLVMPDDLLTQKDRDDVEKAFRVVWERTIGEEISSPRQTIRFEDIFDDNTDVVKFRNITLYSRIKDYFSDFVLKEIEDTKDGLLWRRNHFLVFKGLRLYMAHHFTEKYSNNVTGLAYGGAAFLIVAVGIRGLK